MAPSTSTPPTRLVNALAPRPARRRPGRARRQPHHHGVAGKSQYAATKAALDGLARRGRWSCADRHHRQRRRARCHRHRDAGRPARAATPPKLPRWAGPVQPAEIADLVAFLLSASGRSITGQRLVVCAGASL